MQLTLKSTFVVHTFDLEKVSMVFFSLENTPFALLVDALSASGSKDFLPPKLNPDGSDCSEAPKTLILGVSHFLMPELFNPP